MKNLILPITLGTLFYLNFFLNPFLWYKEYRTLEEVLKVTKYLLILIHVVIIGAIGVLILIRY